MEGNRHEEDHRSRLRQPRWRHVDEVRLLTYPLVLGGGKRLFGAGARPGAFRLTRTTVSPSGVIIAAYERAGEVRTGDFTMDQPTEAERARRRSLE